MSIGNASEKFMLGEVESIIRTHQNLKSSTRPILIDPRLNHKHSLKVGRHENLRFLNRGLRKRRMRGDDNLGFLNSSFLKSRVEGEGETISYDSSFLKSRKRWMKGRRQT